MEYHFPLRIKAHPVLVLLPEDNVSQIKHTNTHTPFFGGGTIYNTTNLTTASVTSGMPYDLSVNFLLIISFSLNFRGLFYILVTFSISEGCGLIG